MVRKERLEEEIDCPRCFVKMEQVESEYRLRRFVTDVCPRCDGIWLDKGELNKVLEDRRLSDHLTKEIGTQTKSELVCPRCGGLMDHEFAEDVEVDVCLSCSGVWLDAGELADLRDLSESGYEGDPDAKLAERLEEAEADARRSRMERFFRKLGL